MSQASGMAGGSFASGPRTGTANKSLPVLLLALAVALGVAFLHVLDDTPTVTEASIQATQAAQESATAAVPVETTSTTLAIRPPSEVKVLVANGTNVSGVAAKVNARLQPIGYQLGTPGNTTTPSTESAVQYLAGYESEARAVATSLGLPSDSVKPIAAPSPVSDIQSANVLVIIGTELASTTAQSNAATASTTPGASGSTATTASPNAGLTGPLGNLSSSATSGNSASSNSSTTTAGSVSN